MIKKHKKMPHCLRIANNMAFFYVIILHLLIQVIFETVANTESIKFGTVTTTSLIYTRSVF